MKSEHMEKQIENFIGFFVCVILRCNHRAFIQCMPTRLCSSKYLKTWRIRCLFGLLFASLCEANSYNVRFKCEMEYWFINSIYGEHNLQKFTNVFIKWNFIRWLFWLQSYFHTISDQVDVVVCVATKHAFTKLCLHSLHPPCGRYDNAIESKCRCLVRWRWCHSPFQNMFWNKLLSMHCSCFCLDGCCWCRRILWLLLKLM